ncbi:urease accessory protein UreH domain-containing protein [Salimicrobium salexigens]|uniref:Cytochrome c biogenesis protein CcdA n=1 Tax=Salimicrobium salexigens TaxID=908941 RepID=A0ABY1KQT2_9BACI|nr:sulfite exporter TauE/SafE family protein [Salimicrobium salexigens]SIS66279.1 Cytochrome c biogenesis protein CcdA [Salimicrobium salexigens]
MYQLFNEVSRFFSQPFMELAAQQEGVPLLGAFFLGLVGAVAPCQMTGNVGAMTIYGNQTFKDKVPWGHVTYFMLGKVLVFSVLGLAVWLFGKEVQGELSSWFPYLRKAIGPMLIGIGLFMIGVFSMKWTLSLGSKLLPSIRNSKTGSFLLGVSITLAFCPTMFVLFFMTLMPMVLTTSYGAALPPIFAIGTSMPLLFFLFLFTWFGIDKKSLMKNGRKIGGRIQKIAGALLLLIGIMDTLTYWF